MKGLKSGIVLFLSVFSGICLGDGKSFSGIDWRSMFPVLEQEQRALILYKNGKEGMLISISLALAEEENAFWIFPLPARPEEIKVDITESFPRIKGKRPESELREYASALLYIGFISQLYTACLCVPTLGATWVDIHYQIDKWGIHAEILSAESAETLMDYLRSKGIGIQVEEFNSFQDYFGGQYTFVLVTIASAKEVLRQFPKYESGLVYRKPALFVEFPAEKLYFPLKPTSGYGEEKVPINLMIQGYATPINPEVTKEGWTTNYYWQRDLPDDIPEILRNYFDSETFRYTRFSFDRKAHNLTEDLWLNVTTPPPGIQYAETVISFVSLGKGVVGIVLIMLIFLSLSYISAGLAGLIFCRRWNPYALLGLGNVLTIFGVYLLIREGKGVLKTDLQGAKVTTRLKYVFVFSLIFLFLTVLIYNLICLPTQFMVDSL